MDETVKVWTVETGPDDSYPQLIGIGTSYIQGLRIAATSRQWWREEGWEYERLHNLDAYKDFKYKVSGSHITHWIGINIEEVELDTRI